MLIIRWNILSVLTVSKVFCTFFPSPPTGFVGENKHTVEQETPKDAHAGISTSGSVQR
jgi:hypothetical protein